tara:strand:- start:4966 stop:5469 length:504 start_codon:yes stop_codon:yes gene_type:complete
MTSFNKYIIIDNYYSNLPKQQVAVLISKFLEKLNDKEFKQTFLEECVDNLTSNGVIAFFTLVGGGIAITSHPVVGSVILIISIACGSFLKVYFGNYYKQKCARKIIPQSESHLNEINLEEGILNVFKKWGSSRSVKYFRTNTAKYGVVRLLSTHTSSRKKIAPETIN